MFDLQPLTETFCSFNKIFHVKSSLIRPSFQITIRISLPTLAFQKTCNQVTQHQVSSITTHLHVCVRLSVCPSVLKTPSRSLSCSDNRCHLRHRHQPHPPPRLHVPSDGDLHLHEVPVGQIGSVNKPPAPSQTGGTRQKLAQRLDG